MGYEVAIGKKAKPSLRVAEMFGPTIQGEGRNAGRRTHFIRLSGCNLACSWCDTPFTWDWKGQNGVAYDKAKESSVWLIDELTKWCIDNNVSNVVITGGEPLTQAGPLSVLLDELSYLGIYVEVETNGTRPCPYEGHGHVQWNVSPKLSTSGNKRGLRPKALATFPRSAIFKFVITDPSDLDEILALHLPAEQVWLMPEGRTAREVNEKAPMVADLAIAHGFNFSHRIHTLLWGDKRGH